ncbi:MAG TPA: riboflavin synthase [Haliangiales bacterium]|nr:riboflavin synthase [Haliangiales bacterium]
MFTGLVEDIGRVERLDRRSEAAILTIAPTSIPAEDLAIGESISVDGVCLTVEERERGRFRVQAGAETLARTTIGALRPGSRVHLERAVRPHDRLGGHIVIGHVDGVGEIAGRRPVGPSVEMSFRAPREVLRYVVDKGSIAVDGISLTVNRVDDHAFDVLLIPHTLDKTALGDKRPGDKVNLEVDIIGKYVEKFVKER